MNTEQAIMRVYGTVVVLLVSAGGLYGSKESGYAPIVTTNKGRVRGQRVTVHGKDVDIFYGIPYAKPPVGDLRFRHPVPNDPWDDTLDATSKPNACIQLIDKVFPNFTGSEMWNANTPRSEDCLYLNVWVPRTNPPFREKTVMIWIFGGGFYYGSSVLDIYEARYLAAENDVIVVSMQYRLGALGFLAMYHRDAPGNAGMFDQVMALDWVQQNIHHFGGSAQKVTLFGESAGAASIGMHLLSPKSRGKFQRVIMQSGAPQSGWAVIPEYEAKRRSMALAEEFNCNESGYSVPDIVNCLRTKPAFEFFDKEWNVIQYGVVRFPFAPIVDGSFLTETPEKSLNSKNYQRCPILIGNTLNEASFWLVYFDNEVFTKDGEVRISQHQFNIIMDEMFDYHPFYPKKLNSFGMEAIKYQYTPWRDQDDQIMNRYALDMAAGDYHFICPTVDFAQHYASTGNDVYYYVYKHRATPHPWPEWMGVLHGDEINFVFGEPLHAPGYTHRERRFTKKVMQYWTNFAKSGDPNQNPGELRLDEWPLYDNKTKKHLVLKADLIDLVDKSMAIEIGPRIQQCAFWKYYLPNLVIKTADMTEMEREWKVQFNEWSTKYIVDWKQQFNTFLQDEDRRLQQACPKP